MWHTKGDGSEPPVQCSLCRNPVIFFEAVPRQKMEILMEMYPHQEWLGYLVGAIRDDQFFIEDLSIPPHKEASGALAEAEPFHIPDRCIGIIHSHHTMGAFHSGTDAAFVDRNFPISITVAKRGAGLEFDAVSYAQTPCGKNTQGKSQIKYVQPQPLFDMQEFIIQAKANIDMGSHGSINNPAYAIDALRKTLENELGDSTLGSATVVKAVSGWGDTGYLSAKKSASKKKNPDETERSHNAPITYRLFEKEGVYRSADGRELSQEEFDKILGNKH